MVKRRKIAKMLILAIGTSKTEIDKAVEILTDMEGDKKILHFREIYQKARSVEELSDIFNSTILLDYPDILAIHSNTKLSKIIYYMVVLSRKRNNVWIAKALDWKVVKEAPNISKRILEIYDLLVTVEEDMVHILDRRNGKRVKLQPKIAGG